MTFDLVAGESGYLREDVVKNGLNGLCGLFCCRCGAAGEIEGLGLWGGTDRLRFPFRWEVARIASWIVRSTNG